VSNGCINNYRITHYISIVYSIEPSSTRFGLQLRYTSYVEKSSKTLVVKQFGIAYSESEVCNE